jgi:serine-type D-Ala-D-Ala carboxypeptidase
MGNGKKIDLAIESAIVDGVFPSASILVAREGEVIHAAQYGGAREDTCFDIASLTKPVSTATIAMFLVSEELLKLEDTVYQWLGGARLPEHKQMTVERLLSHTSGLPAWQPHYLNLPISLIGTDAGRRIVLDECYSESPEYKPGEKTIYSDIGYTILGEILSQAGGAPLDELFTRYVARALNLSNTFFVHTMGAPFQTTKKRTTTSAEQHVPTQTHNKKGTGTEKRHRFAPTEDCPWRERVIHGEVHDQNSYALGGISGQAGLFSTASDLNTFITEITRSIRGESDWLPKQILERFIPRSKTKPDVDSYALGWNHPGKHNSSSGNHFSPNSIGHLAYTGCSFWIDLDQDFWIILLTNRIHPSTTNEKIRSFRPAIHDLIYRELIAK